MLLWVIICSHRNNRLYHFLYLVQMQGFEVKSDEIVAMVSQHGDGIRVGSAGIELGTIDINKLLYLDDKDVSELIYSFIEYALLREEVRRRKKKGK